MAANVKVKHVKIELNRAAIRRIKARGKSELQSWAVDVLRRKVEPVTPIKTGALRRSADILVEGGEKIRITWFWTAPHAPVVEGAWGGRASPKVAGTIAPFAVPTIREVVQDEISQPIGRAFGGKNE